MRHLEITLRVEAPTLEELGELVQGIGWNLAHGEKKFAELRDLKDNEGELTHEGKKIGDFKFRRT